MKDITWYVPPASAGQIVEVAYGADYGTLYRRTTDRSDGVVQVDTAAAADCGCADECGCWQPWNRVPTAYDWVAS
jgi:hypothetical protein